MGDIMCVTNVDKTYVMDTLCAGRMLKMDIHNPNSSNEKN